MAVLRFLGYLSVVIVLGFLAIVFFGGRLPAEHTAVVSAVVPADPEHVWSLMTDFAGEPNWRSDLRVVEPLPTVDGKPCWREVYTSMSMPMCVEQMDRPKRMEVSSADPALPFNGFWTYQLEPASPGATRVTITEHGTTGPVVWRFMGRYLTGEDGQIKRYLGDLSGAVSRQP